ncbi:cobalt ECF transporter T component CbiQ [Trichlorobacter ammonificans]|uniref:Cobalt/nickel transport system permease protein n=1 Tax=Trichlorobacter ammonificans TaxID=2916410 RepID=A0ABM9D525_9BACT|nr:cobalt ECF transporter T component CbiQ [Trichlorobacter ammonificans]CAH2029957.1 Cobalt/nickel transport system permease protein [Trichlorobacter ammonificans]
MRSVEGTLFDFRQLERLAEGSSPLHRLDARAKIVVTLLFIVCVVSLGRYEVAALFPFCIFPALMIAAAGLPPAQLIPRILLVLPVVLVVGIFNPLLDRQILATVGPLAVSGGWLSFVSLVLRSLLTVAAALILVSLTGFPALCRGLVQLGMPRLFAAQLLFLYRYLFVLADEGLRLRRARDQRSFGSRGRGIASFGPLVGHLLLRSWERAERVYRAMAARGFTGEFPVATPSRCTRTDLLFLGGWSLVLLTIRFGEPARLLGELLVGGGP